MDLAADDSNIDGDDEDILPVTKRTMKNMNPIERVERSMLLMGSVLHGVGAKEMVLDRHASRFMELEYGEQEMDDA